jgi:hypothetical protein
MLNEALMIGMIAAPAVETRTATGTECVRSRLRLDETLFDGRTYTTWLRILAFGGAAKKLQTFGVGDFVTLRGKVAWQKLEGDDRGQLTILVRQVDPFHVPSIDGEVHTAPAAGYGGTEDWR